MSLSLKKSEISLVVIVPCFNEEEMLDLFYSELIRAIDCYSYRIIFINDGSTDKTLQKIKFLSAYNNRCQYLSFSRNFGHQMALRAGYNYAKDADCVVSIDADLQQPPLLIGKMVEAWLDGYQVVNAIRTQNRRLPLFKRGSSLLFYKMINYFSSRKIVESSPDFRLLDKKVVNVLNAAKERSLFLRELVSWVGFKQKSIEFEVAVRQYGKSKYSVRKMFSLAINGVFAYGINPLRLAIFIGVILSVMSFTYALYAVFNYLYTNNNIPGWTSMMASFLLIAGFQFILIGVIGEYLGKTYLEIKGRPNYIVDESNISHLSPAFDFPVNEVNSYTSAI